MRIQITPRFKDRVREREREGEGGREREGEGLRTGPERKSE